jgi:hypothetical protein
MPQGCLDANNGPRMLMKRIFFSACSFFLLIALDIETVAAREPYWVKYHIALTGLSGEQIFTLESTINQLRSLEPGDLKINNKLYRRLSRFKDLYGFPFNGPDLSHWLLTRIHSISYHNPWTVAVNQNKGDFFIGDVFFTKTSPLERLYALIHEARHSDDNGYEHVKCPKGFNFISSRQPEMDLEKEPACDDTDQGAYSFQAAFLFELFAYGLFDQGEDGLLYNSSISRVVPAK